VKTLVLRAEAKADALDAFVWYESHRQGLGDEFRDAVGVTLSRLVASPESYAPGYRGLRRAVVRRFPYGIYFRMTGDIVLVVGIIHLKRHPSVAKRR